MPTSIAEIQEITAQNSISIKELILAQKETERVLRETERVLRESSQETERVLREDTRELKLVQQETELAQQKTELALQELDKAMKRTTNQIGGIGNRMGEIAEMVLLPGLVQEINKYHDHKFTKISHRNRYKKLGGGNFAEIDLELRNGEEIMFVEVKSDVSTKSINTFIDRITTLRQNEAVTELVGKTIFAAIAGIHFNNEARDIVGKYGMYLIEVNDDYESDKLVITPPPDDNIGTW